MWKELFAAISGLFSFMLYIRGQGSFEKPMGAAEERECLIAAAQGDRAAREKLIRRNLRLVAHVVKKYGANETLQEDLLSIGTIGLIKAVDSFSVEKGSRFSTYAARCIENAIPSQRNKRRLRWRNGCLLRQNGACWREWESAAIF